jgi:hypothetical protein
VHELAEIDLISELVVSLSEKFENGCQFSENPLMNSLYEGERKRIKKKKNYKSRIYYDINALNYLFYPFSFSHFSQFLSST